MTTLTRFGSRSRQQRLRDVIASMKIDAAFVTDYRDIYYFTGAFVQPWPACLMIDQAGHSWLIAQESAQSPAVDDLITYQPHTLYTSNPDNLRILNGLVVKMAGSYSRAQRLGWQAESMPHLLASTLLAGREPDAWAGMDDQIAMMQTRKDPDELALIRRSIRADLAAYSAAQAAIVDGANELEVLAIAQRAAMLDAGENVYHGGDYRCGEMAGAARDRIIETGELFTVDAQTVYRGYWCDLSRTYCVGAQPTDLQQSIFDHIAAIQRGLVDLLRPGVRGTDIWRMLDERIREHPALADVGLVHHAGHGVGLRAQEAPDLNRDREGILEVGSVVAVEPGAYIAPARLGVRLENMYLITESGAEIMSEYPMNLVPDRMNM